MAINSANIDPGMEVYDSAGEKLGKIEAVVRDPRAESAMQQYQDAVNANVATDADTDDADVEQFTTGRRGTEDDREPGRIGSGAMVGATEQGGIASAGAGTAPGAPGFAAAGVFGDAAGVDEARDETGTSGYESEGIAGGYLHVKEGGLLGLGGKDLYVPMDAVQDVAPGDRITLAVTKEDAEQRFTTRPDDDGGAK